MRINKRSHPQMQTIEFEDGYNLHISCELSGILKVLTCPHGHVVRYACAFIADTADDTRN